MSILAGLGAAAASFAMKEGHNAIAQSRNERNMALEHDYWKQRVNYLEEKNKPSRQVAKWRSAGIAPQAVFGNSPGGVGIATDASSPNSQTPTGSSDFNFVATIAERQRMQNEKAIADATVNKLNAEAEKLRGDTKDPDVTKSQQRLDFDYSVVKKEREEVQKSVDEINKEYARATNEADLQIKQQIFFETIAKIDKLLADKEVSEEMKQNLRSQRALVEAQTETEGSKQRNLDASTDLANAQRKTEDLLRMSKKALTDQQARKVVAELVHQKIVSNTDAYELAKLLAGLHDPRNLWDGIWRVLNIPSHAFSDRSEFATALYQALYKEVND